jgi:phosphate transport system substrate-binding protein
VKVLRLTILCCVLWLPLVVTGCSSLVLVTPEPVTLRIAGSTSLAPDLRDLADAFQQLHPNVVVDVQASDSAAGLRDLANGEADLAAVSWPPPAASPPAGQVGQPVARDAVALIVHPSNTITGLSLVQVKALYQGEVLNWRGLDGPDVDMLVVSREDGSGTRATFESLLMGDERVTLNALVMPSSDAMIDYVAKHPGAIGYVSAGLADHRVRVLPIEEIVPASANIQAGAYHLTRVLYLYHGSQTPAEAQSFLDFALSPAGQAIIGRRHVAIRN